MGKNAIIKSGATKPTNIKGAWNSLTPFGKGAIAVASATALIVLASNIVPFVREIIYWIFRTKAKISNAADLQAEFLQLNIEILKENDGNEKIIAKQEKWLKRFQNIAKAFALESDKAQKDAKKDMDSDKVDVSAIVI